MGGDTAAHQKPRPRLKKNDIAHQGLMHGPGGGKGVAVEALDCSQQVLSASWGLAPPLPDGLVELRLTGCHLTALPDLLTRLVHLKRLFAGANLITSLGPVAQMPGLQHLGLCHNPITALPQARGLQCSALVSLDLSYCCLEDLGGSLESLSALPSLQFLNLSGNPFCLMPGYTATVRCGWSKKLAYMDGVRTDNNTSSSRPATSHASPLPPQSLSSPTAEGGTAWLSMALGPLELLEDPFASTKAVWAAELAAAQTAGTPPAFTASPAPLQPAYYHLEFQSYEGHRDLLAERQAATLCQWTTSHLHATSTLAAQPAAEEQQGEAEQQTEQQQEDLEVQPPASSYLIPAVKPDPITTANNLADELASTTVYCSVPLKVAAPSPPQPEPADNASSAAPKKGAAKPATPLAGKAGSKPTTPLAAATPVQTLQRGCLNASLALPATVAARDWLQEGIRVKLYRSVVTAVLKPGQEAKPKPQTPPPPPKGGKAKPAGKGKAEEETAPVPDLSACDMEVDTQLVGEGCVPGSTLVSGANPVQASEVLLLPIPQLWDDQGFRMSLKDPRHSKQPLARLQATLRLHATHPDQEASL